MSHVTPLTIEIISTQVTNISGISKATGKNYSINKQEAWAFINNSPYPEKLELNLDDGQVAYASGQYLIDLNKCATVDRFGGLSIDMRKAVFHSKTEK